MLSKVHAQPTNNDMGPTSLGIFWQLITFNRREKKCGNNEEVEKVSGRFNKGCSDE